MKNETTDTLNAAGTPLPRAAYVHVPFCRHRCGYCDFSLVAGRDDLVADYLAAIERELTRLDAVSDLDPGNACLELASLYLGGGTPSHLGPDGLKQLFDILRTRLVPLPEAEITIEANPQDVTEPLAAAAAACGTTRVSLGAQSLDTTTLAALDRDHTPDDVRRAVDILLNRGFTVSVDLMTAAPSQAPFPMTISSLVISCVRMSPSGAVPWLQSIR